MKENQIILDGENLSIEDVVAVARFGAKVSIKKSCINKINKSRSFVESIVNDNKVVYGITTGFGPMCNRLVPPENAEGVQKNLIRSHSAGAGEPLPISAVRAAMVVRANSLVKGHSGIRLSTLLTLIEMLNKHVHPYIPEQGSVGASGDLVHLAHMALGLMGEGKSFYNGKLMPTQAAFNRAKIKKVVLSYKEGLALINGTSAMSGIAAINVLDAINLIENEEIATCLAIEALDGTWEAFDERIHSIKPHPGQIKCAARLKKMLYDSKNVKHPKEIRKALQKERENTDGVFKAHNEVQNPYTLRCTPHVLGAVRDTVEMVKRVVEIEINSVTDNPLIFDEDGHVLHGGNFHGQHISMFMDYLSIAMTEVGVLSERRLARILDEKLNYDLPPFLITGDPGFQSGFMGSQYLASSNVAENRVLCNPVSVFTVSTNANNQDIVSMGTVAARKARTVIDNTERIVALELMCNAQAVELISIEKASRTSKAAFKVIRQKVKKLGMDRVMYEDIQMIVDMIRNREIVNAVEKVMT